MKLFDWILSIFSSPPELPPTWKEQVASAITYLGLISSIPIAISAVFGASLGLNLSEQALLVCIGVLVVLTLLHKDAIKGAISFPLYLIGASLLTTFYVGFAIHEKLSWLPDFSLS